MKWALIVFSFGNFTVASGAFTLPGILDPVAGGLGISVVSAGYLMTTYAAAYALGAPMLAALTARADRKTLLLCGLGLFAAANLLMALATEPWIAFLSRILAALGAAIFTPVATYVVAVTSAPDRRGRDLSLAFLGLSIAQILGIPLGTYIGFAFGWRAAFVMIAVSAVAAAVAVWRVAPRGVAGQPMGGAAWAAMARDWRLLAAVAVTGLQMGGQFVVYTYIGPMLAANVGLDAGGITAVLIAFGCASMLGGLAGGWLSDRVGPFTAIAMVLSAMAVGIALLAAAPESLWLNMIGLCIWSVFGFAFTTPQQSRLIVVGARAHAMALALNASSVYIGTAVGGAIGGFMIASDGYGRLGWGGAVLVSAAVAALWISRVPSDARQ